MIKSLYRICNYRTRHYYLATAPRYWRPFARSRNLQASLRAVWRDRGGSSAVEFAAVLPVFLALLLGIVAYASYYGAASSTAQLAADAARASVAGLSDAERVSIAVRQVRASAPSYPLLSLGRVGVEAGPLQADPTEFRVTVRYDARDLPIWTFARMLPLPPQIIERTAVIKRGGF